RWTEPYSAFADSYASLFAEAGDSWDAETAANVFGGVTPGVEGTAGTFDGVNQISFVDLGSTSAIAVTTTWYYTSTGVAVESDGRYNLGYAWDTTGAADAMDVLNIALHELGHTLGLNHPNGKPFATSCLTMYAYADFGETAKRSLGDGDILGIEAIYGA
ncbi:MAG: matrixin family metalloprotease, partial [Actinomycetota bacterium]